MREVDGNPRPPDGGCFAHARASCANEFPNRNDPIHQAAAEHFAGTARWLTDMSRQAGAAAPEALATELLILAQGALSHRMVTGDDHAARAAGRVARALIDAALN